MARGGERFLRPGGETQEVTIRIILGLTVTERQLKLFLGRIVAGPNGCHICTYYAAPNEYPKVGWKSNQRVSAHRFAYEYYIGEIPEDEIVLHKCDNTRCVNPNHLKLGSYQDNRLDCIEKGRANIIPRQLDHVDILPLMQKLRREGLSYQAIGEQLGVSWGTVRKYITKFGLGD